MKKRVAVIGYGGQGAWHCAQIMKSDVVTLAGTYDIKENRRAAAKENGIFVYDSNQAIFADNSVDIVVVATPNDVHEDLVVSSLKSGKNVICEKPVALSVDEFDRMTAAAEESCKLFTVHQNRRWDVDFLACKKVIDSGEIGNVLRIESRIHGSRGIPSDWRCKKEPGGGMVLDWGVHLIDQMLQLIPETIVGVNCVCTHITNSKVDDGFRLELDFAGGKTAHIEVGTYNFLAMPRFYMQCSDGSLYLEDWQRPAHIAKLTRWIEKDVTPVQNAAGITKTMAPRDSLTLDEYDIERPISDVHEFYRNFCAAINGEAQQLIRLDEVRRVLCVMEACFESDFKHQTLKVNI
ncbi:MAG: Gfo/Idh/MocA family oxidoreductase [Ruminococcaceae bacterium]|nr:Gfo/Idh/MocA family oxidoreductase [Oscillospiraceae bacterium]